MAQRAWTHYSLFSKILIGSAVLAGSAGAQSQECRTQSGSRTAALLELYTSEGCNSCPPADRWISALKADDIATGRVVPLALHVDYWDSLGWKDRFAKSQFTARQRELSRLGGHTFVYTPQVLLDGRDYRAWDNSRRFDSDVKKINSQPPAADIDVALAKGSAPSVSVSATVADPARRPNAQLYVAFIESGLTSKVLAGENRGETLKHDYVVRELWGPVGVDATGRAVLKRSPSATLENGALAVVAFVQDRLSGAVLQAHALSGCGP